MTDKSQIEPELRLAAVCGLFCPSCTIYIGTTEDPQRLESVAERFGATVEAVRCFGCRAEQRLPYCAQCKMAACAAEKGLDFCGACDEYPCEELETFQAARVHRIELWRAQERIQEVGYERWFEEMVARYACSQCGALNSAYDLVCRKCGADPSCAYVDAHREEILQYLSEQG